MYLLGEIKQVVCSTKVDCNSSESSFPPMMSARDCCVNRENGFSYSIPGEERCYQCKGWPESKLMTVTSNLGRLKKLWEPLYMDARALGLLAY